MKRIITLLVMLTSLSFAQTNTTYQGEIDQFFNLLEKGESREAVKSIYSTNPWMNKKPEDVQQLSQKLDNLLELVGDYCGNLYLVDTNVKDRFVHVVYLALYERQPIRVEFQFYKAKEDWMIYAFSFDVDFDDDIEEITKWKMKTLKAK